MKRILLTVISVCLAVLCSFASFAADISSNSFWNNATQWINIPVTLSENAISAKYRYFALSQEQTADPRIALNVNISDSAPFNKYTSANVSVFILIKTSYGAVLDEFEVFADSGEFSFKGSNGTLSGISDSMRAVKGGNYRFAILYNELSSKILDNDLILAICCYDSDHIPVSESEFSAEIEFASLGVKPPEEETTKKASQKKSSSSSSKSSKKQTKTKKSGSKSVSTTKKRYSNSYAATTKSPKGSEASTDFEQNEAYNKAQVVLSSAKENDISTKQVVFICIGAAALGTGIAIIVSEIIKNKKHSS